MLFLFSKFKWKKWNKLTPEKRFMVLRALEKKVAKWLDIEPLDLEIKEGSSNWNCFGAFTATAGGTKIVLNEMLIYEPQYRFHALETIAHETRHAYQYSVVDRELKWYEFTAKKWKRNWAGYFSSSTDNLMYNNQAVERDAQKYSIKILKRYKGKYGNEEDYNYTLEAVVHRYEQADIDARKRFGLFYKQKIEKNVKNNSRF